MTRSVFDFAHKFIKDGLDKPRNTKKGNMKIQKLLYFAYLVHHAEFGKPLFDDKIYAFENGCIVESVMNHYRARHEELVRSSINAQLNFSPEEKFTVDLVESVFGGLTADELSELNHEHTCWKLAYDRSYIGFDFRDKHSSEIKEDEIYSNDLDGIKRIVDGYKSTNNTPEDSFEIDGTTFYFNPHEIIIDEDLKTYLKGFAGGEDAFSIYKDRSQGIIVY